MKCKPTVLDATITADMEQKLQEIFPKKNIPVGHALSDEFQTNRFGGLAHQMIGRSSDCNVTISRSRWYRVEVFSIPLMMHKASGQFNWAEALSAI